MQVGLGYLLKKWRRQSIIVLVIATVIGGSAILMGIVGAFDFVHRLQAGEYQGFRSLCGTQEDN